MKNKYKFKTPKERGDAFSSFCKSNNYCSSCPIQTQGKGTYCFFQWLELDVKTSENMISDLIEKVCGEDILSRKELVKKLLPHRDEIQKIWQAQDNEGQNER